MGRIAEHAAEKFEAAEELLRPTAGTVTADDRKAYWAASAKAQEAFAVALAEEYAISYSGLATDIFFQKAWDTGHSSGLDSVENHYQDLVDFVDRINAAN